MEVYYTGVIIAVTTFLIIARINIHATFAIRGCLRFSVC